MVTDIVCEHLVQRKNGVKDILKAVGIGAAALILSAADIIFLSKLGGFNLIIIAALIYGAVRLIKLFTAVEYEYSFINGELTIDRIVNQSERKKMISFETKKVEKAGRYNSEFNPYSAGTVLNYADCAEPENAFYLQFRDSEKGMTTVIISCPDEYIEKMKPYFNQLVFRDAFKN